MPKPHKTYETAGLPEKALGKLRQYAARGCYQAPLHIPEGFRAVSICFDDFPESAAINGAPLLEAFGARGTFYTCFGALGMEGYDGPLASLDAVLALRDGGHEIACHTYEHTNASFNSAASFMESCKKNMEAAAALGISLEQLSYPQGGMSVQSKRTVREHYQSARSGFMGINRDICDVFCLKSVPFYQNHVEKVRNFLGKVAENGGWLILYTHDVCEAPSPHGITINALRDVMEECQRRHIPVRPVGAVLQSLKETHE